MFPDSGITQGLHGFTVPTPLSTEFNKDIGINGYNPVTIERTTTYVDDDGAVSASDVTNLTSTTNEVNTNIAETYNVTYSGTKGGETVTATRKVVVEDTTEPTLNSVSINSYNTTTTFPKADDIVTLEFTASEPIEEPVVTFQ